MQTPQDKAVTEQVLFSFMLHSKCQKVVTWNILLFKKMQKQEKLVYQNLKKLPPHLFLCHKVSPACRLNSPLFIFNPFSNILYSYFFISFLNVYSLSFVFSYFCPFSHKFVRIRFKKQFCITPLKWETYFYWLTAKLGYLKIKFYFTFRVNEHY